jgi:hypothetical protein
VNFSGKEKSAQYCKNTRVKLNGKITYRTYYPVPVAAAETRRAASLPEFNLVSNAGLRDDSFSFRAFIALAGFEVLELFGAAARPLDYDAVGLIFPAEAEG